MTVPNQKPSTDTKRNKLSKRSNANERLSFETWVLLIISFALLGYALYVIQTRILDTNIDNIQATPTVTQQSQ
ncbi:hypothetical protein [Psychrobacter sp. M13]|uniref:hypothetical protein n=1 Tax=Psychrobacter sp. M13 TaxID=3067275 RepID=UPI00191B869B|nr:hypothetical protein [Psychrobacter sp. M13]WLP95051.1 hypothetical protein Q9G97_02745 [Psychrobacter sp. M13]